MVLINETKVELNDALTILSADEKATKSEREIIALGELRKRKVVKPIIIIIVKTGRVMLKSDTIFSQFDNLKYICFCSENFSLQCSRI